MSVDTSTDSEAGVVSDTLFDEDRAGRRLFRGAVGTAAFLVVWQVAAMPVPTFLLPTPIEVARAFVVELTAPAVFEVPIVGAEIGLTRLLVNLIDSLYHYIPGLVVGGTAGIAAGIAMGWSGLLNEAFTPIQRVLRPIPPLAWIAFAIVWLGVNHSGAAFIVGIGAFWVNFYNAYAGVEGVSQGSKEVAASLGVDDDITMIRKVVIPSATPEIMTGIRTSIGQGWMIVVAAELFGAPGIGFQIINAAQNLSLDVSVAYMFVISLVFLVSDGVFRRVERRVLVWRE